MTGRDKTMKITNEFLTQNTADDELIEYFNNNKLESEDIFTFLEKLNGGNKFRALNWFLTRLLNKTNNIKYAIFASEKVLCSFECDHKNDDRPRKAIYAAKECLAGNENYDIARDDVWSTAASTDRSSSARAAAAAYAADAAYSSSAIAAARSAASAADAASSNNQPYVARSSAVAALYAVDSLSYYDDCDVIKKELGTKIISYGIELLKQQLEGEAKW